VKLTRRQNFLVVIILVAVLLITVLDVVSPLLVHRRLGSAAREAAGAAERAYLETGSEAAASDAARSVTDRRLIVLTRFQVLNGGAIRVTVGDDAGSYYLSRIPLLHEYYTVQESATANPKVGTPTTTPPTNAP
jgi:hypothetical protein